MDFNVLYARLGSDLHKTLAIIASIVTIVVGLAIGLATALSPAPETNTALVKELTAAPPLSENQISSLKRETSINTLEPQYDAFGGKDIEVSRDAADLNPTYESHTKGGSGCNPAPSLGTYICVDPPLRKHQAPTAEEIENYATQFQAIAKKTLQLEGYTIAPEISVKSLSADTGEATADGATATTTFYRYEDLEQELKLAENEIRRIAHTITKNGFTKTHPEKRTNGKANAECLFPQK